MIYYLLFADFNQRRQKYKSLIIGYSYSFPLRLCEQPSKVSRKVAKAQRNLLGQKWHFDE